MLKPIKDFDGYFVSRDGKIFCNLGRGNRRKTGRTVELYEINPRPTKNGYMRVYMRNTVTNKRVDKYVHRLVAEAFIDNPNQYKCVNHINCDRADNRWTNLEWVDAKANTQQTMDLNHAYRNSKGQYVGNFKYTRYSLLPEQERKNIAIYIVANACSNKNMQKCRV